MSASPDCFDDYSLHDFADDLAEDEMDEFLLRQLQAEEEAEPPPAEWFADTDAGIDAEQNAPWPPDSAVDEA